MGGIYGGIFTATEAGAVGAVGALLIPLARRQIKSSEIWMPFGKPPVEFNDCYPAGGRLYVQLFLAITQIPNQFGEYYLVYNCQHGLP